MIEASLCRAWNQPHSEITAALESGSVTESQVWGALLFDLTNGSSLRKLMGKGSSAPIVSETPTANGVYKTRAAETPAQLLGMAQMNGIPKNIAQLMLDGKFDPLGRDIGAPC
jgi:hypothetical protein